MIRHRREGEMIRQKGERDTMTNRRRKNDKNEG